MMELAFTLEEYRQRFENLKKTMEDQSIDTVYLTSPESIYYFTGHHRVMPGGRSPVGAAVNQEANDLVFFCEKDEESFLRRTSVVREAYFFGTEWGGGDDPYPVILETLANKGWLKGTVGVEKQTWYPCYDAFQKLVSGLEASGARIVDASETTNTVRWVKSNQELAYIKEAAKIADAAMEAAKRALRPGATELDIVAEIESTMYRAGGGRPAITTMVQSGHRSVMQHGVPTQRVINSGDIVQVDFCGVSQRYHADLGRTFCLGDPPDCVAEVMKKAAVCFQAVKDMVAPTAPLAELSRVAREYYESHNITPWYDQGYTLGIGFEPSWMGVPFHEKGFCFSPGVVTNFDHCFNFEELSIGTCTIDTLIMTEKGLDLLSSFERDLVVL